MTMRHKWEREYESATVTIPLRMLVELTRWSMARATHDPEAAAILQAAAAIMETACRAIEHMPAVGAGLIRGRMALGRRKVIADLFNALDDDRMFTGICQRLFPDLDGQRLTLELDLARRQGILKDRLGREDQEDGVPY